MIDVIYCPQCKQFRKSEEGYGDDELNMYLEHDLLKCPTCQVGPYVYLYHIDDNGVPRLYEIICGEDLPMYDTDFMIGESMMNLKDKESILKKALVLSRKWTKEKEVQEAEEEKRRKAEETIRRAEKLTELLKKKHDVENAMKPLSNAKDYLIGQYTILNQIEISDPIIGKSKHAIIDREFFESRLKEVRSDIDKTIAFERELADIDKEIKSMEGLK